MELYGWVEPSFDGAAAPVPLAAAAAVDSCAAAYTMSLLQQPALQAQLTWAKPPRTALVVQITGTLHAEAMVRWVLHRANSLGRILESFADFHEIYVDLLSQAGGRKAFL